MRTSWWRAALAAGSSRGAIVALFALCVLTFPRQSAAQIDKTVALGGGVAHYHPVDESAHDSTGFAIVYRFGRPQAWRPAFGLNWFTTRFDAAVGDQRVTLGDLRVRPIMGGYGYTVRRGRLAATASAVGGVAFNSFEATSAARIAYAQSLNRVLLDVRASNGVAARGEFLVWYDLNERIGIMGNIGYIVARPNVDVLTNFGTETRRLKADSVKFQVGVAYGIF